MPRHRVATLLALGATALGLALAAPTPARADCAHVQVWLNRQGASPQPVADQCPATPFPTAFDVYRNQQATGVVPTGWYDGAGFYVSVPLP